MKVFYGFKEILILFAFSIILPSILNAQGAEPAPRYRFVSITGFTPASGSTLTGMVTIRSTATFSEGSTCFQRSCTMTMTGGSAGKTYNPIQGTTFDTAIMETGNYTLRATCSYDSGQIAGALPATKQAQGTATYTIGRDSTPPTVRIINMNGGERVAGTIIINATATDVGGSAISGLQFFAGSNDLGIDTTSPYMASFDTTKTFNGPLTLRVHAMDSIGNVGIAQIVVNVDNPGGTLPPPIPPTPTVRPGQPTPTPPRPGQPTPSVPGDPTPSRPPQPPGPDPTSTPIDINKNERIFKITVIDRRTRETLTNAFVTYVTESGNKKIQVDDTGVAQMAFLKGARVAASVKARGYNETSTKVFKLNDDESVTVKMARRDSAGARNGGKPARRRSF